MRHARPARGRALSGSGDQQLLPVSQTGAPAPARPAATVLPRVGICATMFSGMNSWFTPFRERLGLAAPSRSPPATQVDGESQMETNNSVPSRSAQDPAPLSGTPGVGERNRPGNTGQGGVGLFEDMEAEEEPDLDPNGVFARAGCCLARHRCLTGCEACPKGMAHVCSMDRITTAVGSGGTVVCRDVDGATGFPLNVYRAQALHMQWQRSYGPKRDYPVSKLVDMDLRVCAHVRNLLKPDAIELRQEALAATVPETPGASEEPLCCESCKATVAQLEGLPRKQKWQKPTLCVLKRLNGKWVCNQDKCRRQRQRERETAREEQAADRQRTTTVTQEESEEAQEDESESDSETLLGKRQRPRKPLSVDTEAGRRRTREYAKRLAVDIEQVVMDLSDEEQQTAVLETIGKTLPRYVPGAFPRHQEKSDALAMLGSAAGPLVNRDRTGTGRTLAHATAMILGGSAVPVRRQESLLRSLVGDNAFKSSGALRDLLSSSAERRAADPQLTNGFAPPSRARNAHAFRNNPEAVQIVLRTAVKEANLTGFRRDINRPPPGVRPSRAEDVAATSAGFLPTDTDVELMASPEGVTWSSEQQRRRRRNVLRTIKTGDDIFEMLTTDPELQAQLTAVHCAFVCLTLVYWALAQFLWFVKPYSRAHREGCACFWCAGWRYKIMRLATLTGDSHLTPNSIFDRHLCEPVELCFGAYTDETADGSAASSVEGSCYRTKGLFFRPECVDRSCEHCGRQWSAELTATQQQEKISWLEYVTVVEGRSKTGDKDKKAKRERRRTGTGAELAREIQHEFDLQLHHHQHKLLFSLAMHEHQNSGYTIWYDYSARMTIANMHHNQSSEMSPQQIGAFIAVVTRPFGSIPSDDGDTIKDEFGVVKEHHIVLFDYNSGTGSLAVNSQKSPCAEACLSLIMLFESGRGLDMAKCDELLTLMSDNCCADLKCADHFGHLETWVNPDSDASPEEVFELKKKLCIKNLIRLYGLAMHGKYEGDGVATRIRDFLDKCTLAVNGGENVSSKKIEHAGQLYDELKLTMAGQGQMKGQRRAAMTGWASAVEDAKVNATHFHFLSVDFFHSVRDATIGYKRIAAPKGDGSSTWHEVRFTAGSEGKFSARKEICACDGCMHMTACQKTHHADNLMEFQLERRVAGAATVVESDVESDEEDVPHQDEAEDEMAKLLESQGAIFQELSRSSRNGKLVVFIVADEPYQLLLMKSQVVGELTSAQCTGHLLKPVPGLAVGAKIYYAEVMETTVAFRGADRVCILANAMSDILLDTDEIVIDGQLDHQRYQVPAATHELFQEKQFDYQYSGILSS